MRAADEFNPRTRFYTEGDRFGATNIRISPRSTRKIVDTVRAADDRIPLSELDSNWQKVPAAIARTVQRTEKGLRRSEPGTWLQQLLTIPALQGLDTTSESPALRRDL